MYCFINDYNFNFVCLGDASISGIITKENINKRGCNKFLKLTDNVKVELYQGKINEDEKWDGLKG
jgi:hypothetical protein